MFFRDLEKFQLCGPREVNFSLNSLRSRKLYLEYVCHLLIIWAYFIECDIRLPDSVNVGNAEVACETLVAWTPSF